MISIMAGDMNVIWAYGHVLDLAMVQHQNMGTAKLYINAMSLCSAMVISSIAILGSLAL